MVLSNEMTSQSSNNGQVDADENESITEYRSKFQTNFEILDHLGEGGYGIVFKVRDKNDGKEYAVKRIELPKHSGWQLIEREIRIRDCDHPNIVKYFDSWIEQPPQEWQENEDLKWREAFNLLSISSGSASNESEILSTQSSSAYLYIQMELCEGDLAEWLLNTDRHVRENRIGSIFKQIIAAVKYIHGKKLIHRDLKPANILIGSEGVIKIGDFGTTVEHDCRNTQKKHSACPKSHTEGIGTGWYIAPEVERGYYSYSADIFSLGVILFELINPFRTAIERNAVLDALRNTAFPKDFDDQYKPEFEFVKKMLSANWKKRPTIDTIERHFSSARWSEIFVPTQVDALTIIDLILDVISRIVQNILNLNRKEIIILTSSEVREKIVSKSRPQKMKKNHKMLQ